MKIINLQVDLVSNCCGAKMLSDFPDWWDEGYAKEVGRLERYQLENKENTEAVERALKRFFDEGGTYHASGTSEPFKYKALESPGGSLGHNAFIFAITNWNKDRLMRPILEKFGFKCIAEEKNPNSGNIVYTYLWRWSETRDNQHSLYPLSPNKIKAPLAEQVDAGVLKTPDISRVGSIPSGGTIQDFADIYNFRETYDAYRAIRNR